jgi:hypothetical protein
MDFLKDQPYLLLPIIATVLLVIFLIITLFKGAKSSFTFNEDISGGSITEQQPKVFPPFTDNNGYVPKVPAGTKQYWNEYTEYPKGENQSIPLLPATIKEETGLAMLYPQGAGVGMTSNDSNAFTPDSPGSLLTDYKIPEAYGESSLSDPYGNNGANQASRILKIKNLGNQVNFKPTDEAIYKNYATAYSNANSEVESGFKTVNGTNYIDYSDDYSPSGNLMLQSSPGQMSVLSNCETTYPHTEKYKEYCITDGDIPYGQVVNGKVNPRLVSRWQSYTGDYNPQEALEQRDGLLYPILNILGQGSPTPTSSAV